MVEPVSGPAALVLTATVARRFYLDGRSKLQIAEELGLSRFKVARLVESARRTGLVRIEIRPPGRIDVDLSARLQERYGLPRAVVVGTADDSPGILRAHVAQAAADLLAEVTGPGDVLGMAWSRAVGAMARTLSGLPLVPVVQISGAVSLPDGGDSVIDIVRDAARATGGPAHVFYAPMIVPDRACAVSLRRLEHVGRVFGQLPHVTRAVVGLGLCAEGHSGVYDAASDRERASLHRLGAVAEVAGVIVSSVGEPIETELTERLVSVSAEQLRRIPDTLLIAYGTDRVPAAQAVLASGMVTELVTHSAFARALLLDQPPPA